jgi:hypothetical protein
VQANASKGVVVREAVFVLAFTALALLPGRVLAYEDTGFDPDDRRPLGSDPDLRSTTRTVWHGDDGRRRLRIRIQAYEPFGLWWFVEVRIDSRGGLATDFVMRIWNQDQSGKGCSIHPRGHPGQAERGRFGQRADRARCTVLLSTVNPTKRLRWKLVSPTGYGPPGERDVAPNDLTFYP